MPSTLILFLFDMGSPVSTAITLAEVILVFLIVLGLTAAFMFIFVIILKRFASRSGQKHRP